MDAIRETYHSKEYDSYYNRLDKKTQAKYDFVEEIIRTQQVVNRKFVKHLESTEFYEARISINKNEYRTIIFAIDSISFIESKQILFFFLFLKKGTKQYRGEINTARNILNKYLLEEENDNGKD